MRSLQNRTKKPASERSFAGATLALPVAVLCAGILTAGFRYDHSQQRDMKAGVVSQLSAIADLKVQQIVAWRSERTADAALLAEDPLLVTGQGKRQIQGWLEAFRRCRAYTEVDILDRRGNVGVSARRDGGALGSGVRPLIEAALQSHGVAMSDLEQFPDGSVYMDMAAPILRASGAPRFVFLRVETSPFLYALVEAWPAPSPTAECLLVRQEGGRIRYLNEPRHAIKAAFEMTLPVGSDLPAGMAVLGKEGVHEGRDYRNFEVVAAVRRIPDSPWALVAKVDAGEIYSLLDQRTLAIRLVVGLLLSACFATVGIAWHLQKTRFYRREHQADLARQALAGRYAHLSRYVNDIVLLLDEDGRILEANDRAASAYGYSSEELLGLSIQDLLEPSQLLFYSERVQEVHAQGSAVFESIHRRKDGSSFAVEVSSRAIENEGRKLRQSVYRDITERKRAEEELRCAVRAMRVLSASNQALVRSHRRGWAVPRHLRRRHRQWRISPGLDRVRRRRRGKVRSGCRRLRPRRGLSGLSLHHVGG